MVESIQPHLETGISRHYGFIKFESFEVAAIVADSMNNYLLFESLLQVKVVPIDKQHPKMWTGANRKIKPSSFEASNSPYARLCRSASEGPLAEYLQLRPSKNGAAEVESFLTNLLDLNPKFSGDAYAMVESRLQDAHLLLESRPAKGLRGREWKHRRSRKGLTMRQHRLLGSYALPEEARKYKMYLELHEMWKDYAEDVVDRCSGNDAMIHSRFLTADLHGAVLAVVESKDPALVGNQGIMVRETTKTFGLVTTQNKFVVVPKVGSIFKLIVSNLTLTLFGSNLGIREVGS